MAKVATRGAINSDFTHKYNSKLLIIMLLYYSTSVRVARIELASQPWEGRMLPLYHTRILYLNKPFTHLQKLVFD